MPCLGQAHGQVQIVEYPGEGLLTLDQHNRALPRATNLPRIHDGISGLTSGQPSVSQPPQRTTVATRVTPGLRTLQKRWPRRMYKLAGDLQKVGSTRQLKFHQADMSQYFTALFYCSLCLLLLFSLFNNLGTFSAATYIPAAAQTHTLQFTTVFSYVYKFDSCFPFFSQKQFLIYKSLCSQRSA